MGTADVSVTLTTIDGCLAVEMPDHRRRIQRYLVDVLANNAERFSVRLVKLNEDDDDMAYLVQIGPRWHACDCMDYQCRKCKAGELCKHLDAAYQLRDLLRTLAGTVSNPVKEAHRAAL
jgi:hypothetical protein